MGVRLNWNMFHLIFFFLHLPLMFHFDGGGLEPTFIPFSFFLFFFFEFIIKNEKNYSGGGDLNVTCFILICYFHTAPSPLTFESFWSDINGGITGTSVLNGRDETEIPHLLVLKICGTPSAYAAHFPQNSNTRKQLLLCTAQFSKGFWRGLSFPNTKNISDRTITELWSTPKSRVWMRGRWWHISGI